MDINTFVSLNYVQSEFIDTREMPQVNTINIFYSQKKEIDKKEKRRRKEREREREREREEGRREERGYEVCVSISQNLLLLNTGGLRRMGTA